MGDMLLIVHLPTHDWATIRVPEGNREPECIALDHDHDEALGCLFRTAAEMGGEAIQMQTDCYDVVVDRSVSPLVHEWTPER